MSWNINLLPSLFINRFSVKFFVFFCRTVFSPKTFLILPFMFTGRVYWEFTPAITAANVGTSLSMARSVLLLCRLTELSTWRQAVIKISIASAILRGTVITSIKERCAWDSGSEIAPDMETLMGTLDGSQCPAYLLKKFLKLKLKRDFRLKWLKRFMSYNEFLYYRNIDKELLSLKVKVQSEGNKVKKKKE